jgi:hypothetical protein
MRVLRYRRLGLGAIALGGALGVGAAFAQPAVPTYPECTKKASAQDTEAAKNAHKVATEFYDRGDYDKAIRYWTDSYAFDCSANALLVNIANSYEKKGDRAAAVATLKAYLKRSGPNPTVEEKVKNLEAALAPPVETASAAPSASAPPSASVPPPPPSASVPPPLPVGPRPYGNTPWFLVGGGGALAIVGAILVPVGISAVSSANKACPTHVGCTPSVANEGNGGRSEEGAGWGLLGVGVAAAAGGLIWQLAFNEPKASAPPKTGVWVMPTAGKGQSGVVAGGSF